MQQRFFKEFERDFYMNIILTPAYSRKFILKFAFYFLRYAQVRYIKSLFTNIQKQQNLLKISQLFKKFTNFTGKECEIFTVLFLHENKGIGRFSNLHQRTFKLSNENYFFALNLLRECFHNEQLQVWTYMKKLLKIPLYQV